MVDVPTNSLIFRLIEELAPKEKAYSWDNVGLQIGSANQKATKVMITLDVVESVVDEAIEKDVNLIIAHHPLFFNPLKRINVDTPEGKIISKLIRHDITVYAAHTNLDVVASGVNDMLAKRLKLQNNKTLISLGKERMYKFAVYVPTSHIEAIKNVIGDVGGGEQGDYSHCSFEIKGIGSFKPIKGADPYIGKVGEITKVDEAKIEVLVTESKLNEVKKAVLKAHPYEEPAYDIIELANEGAEYGLGRIGDLSERIILDDYVKLMKQQLGLNHVRVAGNLEKEIKKVAIIGGSGEKYIHQAKRAGADVYITGDLGFHQAQTAIQIGLAVIDAGHYIEEIMKEEIKDYLQKKLASNNVEIIVSDTNTDPFQYI
ncbi:Nif3-like dinuclear metal center hexameric protein [Oceanobacillus luteolus]|uniref:GTP cyclohydrolase 1 type 2 homolog n=1 Tax=Oceanobacillus luteolus TaxID=1274358 RepID=A0ABW4HYI1_9BACI|nr:Nif3-like dinuclear metal center hexameric protein [Oceanobacillus luteolus]MCM3738718.1 Nif3-like dinuclear metal center hexameric protein [Oceanobacillus luteolus]